MLRWRRKIAPNFGSRPVMPKRRLQLGEIIGKLGNADILLGQSNKIAEVVKALGMHLHVHQVGGWQAAMIAFHDVGTANLPRSKRPHRP
jgi:hypothetical protein